MNSAQRLLRIATVFVVGIMLLFPPYLVREDKLGAEWIRYAPFWQPPYPTREEVVLYQPYCTGSRASGFLLLAQITLLWMGSSALYGKLGKIPWDPEKYPEYYRP